MSRAAEAAVETEEVVEREPAAAKPKDKPKPKRQPLYGVILHNDDLNGFLFVVGVLRKIFKYGRIKAYQLTFEAHAKGRSLVWSGQLEHAELKADQMRSCGPDPEMVSRGALALRVTIEPLPE